MQEIDKDADGEMAWNRSMAGEGEEHIAGAGVPPNREKETKQALNRTGDKLVCGEGNKSKINRKSSEDRDLE